MRLASKLCIGASLALLVLSIWPARMSLGLFAAFTFSLIWLPLTAFAVLRSASQECQRPGEAARASRTRSWALSAGATLLLTLAALCVSLPVRLGFAASRSAFEAGLAGPHDPGRPLGLYRVDRRDADPRGGVYFRTGTSEDGPFITSWGIAHRPNPKGSPYGMGRYDRVHLTGDWYAFSASDH
ncbi:hypothetical protein EP7_005376 [Isosphaeraceae bacterium EP7]